MEEKKGFFAKLKKGLSKTRDGWLANVFSREGKVDDDFYEELEEAMIMADMGMLTTEKLLDELRDCLEEQKIRDVEPAKEALIRMPMPNICSFRQIRTLSRNRLLKRML